MATLLNAKQHFSLRHRELVKFLTIQFFKEICAETLFLHYLNIEQGLTIKGLCEFPLNKTVLFTMLNRPNCSTRNSFSKKKLENKLFVYMLEHISYAVCSRLFVFYNHEFDNHSILRLGL